MQKNKIQDYDSFRNEITILMQLVIVFRSYSSARTTQILSSCTKLGRLNESASLSLSKYLNAHKLRDQSFCRLCEGGELFFYITKSKHLTESSAAAIMR